MRNNVINNIRLDLNKEIQRVSVSVRKNDTTSRRLDITLVDHGQVIDLSNASIAIFMGKKPNQNELYNDCVINGNEIQYTLTTQTINVVGEVKCNVQVSFKDGSLITSPEFIITVYDPVMMDSYIESMNEYNAISQFVTRAEQSAEEAEGYALQAEASAGIATEGALLSQSWAEGGTGARAGEDENNARFFSNQAAGSAQETAALRTEAAEYAETAGNYAQDSLDHANDSAQSAATSKHFSEISTEQAEEATRQKEISATNALSAQLSASNAATSEHNAESSAEASYNSERMSESYAVGTNGVIRDGDKTDNAKYYKEQAEAALSGNVVAAFEIKDVDGCLYYAKTIFDDATDNHFDFAIADDSDLEVTIYG